MMMLNVIRRMESVDNNLNNNNNNFKYLELYTTAELFVLSFVFCYFMCPPTEFSVRRAAHHEKQDVSQFSSRLHGVAALVNLLLFLMKSLHSP